MSFLTNKRTYLNQLDHRLSCSIIGTCLSLKELRKLARKARLTGLKQITDYELHRIYVGIAEERSYANRSLQKCLDNKFKETIKQFTVIKTELALKERWKKALKTGDIAATYWTLLTHPSASNALIDILYGDVHMLSHISGASMRVDLHELSLLRHENRALKQQQQQAYQKHSRTLYEKDDQLRKHKKELQKQQQEINALKISLMHQPQQETDYSDESSSLRNKLHLAEGKVMRLEQKAAIYQVRWEAAIHKQSDQESKLMQVNEERKSVESILKSYLLAQQNKPCVSSDYCSQKDLQGKCILYVGGRDKQCRHFKTLVESSNGQFIHHDGGLSDGSSKLNSTLAKADAVMCPLDCISHEAMIKVKKHCQFTAKKLVMMPRSSLSAFSKGLGDVVN